MQMGWPSDASLYKLLTDWGGFIGAVIALFAAFLALLAIRAQIRETRSEFLAQRRAAERRVAIFLLEAALEGFAWDIYHVLNTFHPDSQERIEPERERFLRERLQPIALDIVAPHIGRIDPEMAREFSYLVWIGQRARRESATTYAGLREQLHQILDRTKSLQEAMRDLDEQTRLALGDAGP